MSKKVVVDTVVKDYKLTEEDNQIALKIKDKLRKTADIIVEIGEELSNAIENKPRGFKEEFYKAIGISDRSAQRYMQIANHVRVIELKEKKELEGKTMTDLLQLITPAVDTSKSTDSTRVAKSFYGRYKNKPEQLEEIISELQKLLNESKTNIIL